MGQLLKVKAIEHINRIKELNTRLIILTDADFFFFFFFYNSTLFHDKTLNKLEIGSCR